MEESMNRRKVRQSVKICLKKMVEGSTRVPEGFNIHPKLKKFLEKRKELIEGNSEAGLGFC